ncbi:MAG TPA: aromatic ring-hydroxylating dioxygenase subunit alpha [Casimicrobiaceae bacterium]|nr:aromatic ring-hydroxylating dioxygenase subunit alpha [Casimicrobiaceae bacterium]
MFLRNAWYAAGFSDEFGRQLVARTYLNEAVVIYRTRDGVPVAFEDRCAHRRLPLSMGRLIEDRIECGYHGLVYDCSGMCVKIPGQVAQSIPPGARVRTYPVADRHFYLWIWMGDPALADPDLIPDFSALAAAGTERHRIKLHLDCHFQLVVDNLLDLSHLAYVHSTTTGNAAIAEDAVVKTLRQGDTVQIKRWVSGVQPSPTFELFGGYEDRVNLWQVSQYAPPTYIRVSYGSSDASVPMTEADDIWRHGQWGFDIFHGITPETERTTHQFRYVGFEPSFGDAVAIAEFLRQCDQIINEDREIFAVQQRALDSDPRGLTANDLRSTAPIHADQGLAMARRILDQHLAAEASVASSTTGRAVRQTA